MTGLQSGRVRSVGTSAVFAVCLLASALQAAATDSLQPLRQGFQTPPRSARPWVYWFWLNGNLSREGITLDLEAMARTGVGGVLIMEVDQGVPAGAVEFAGPEWRRLFRHVCNEAARLGLEVNMNNDAGWCGSGGPWVPPELAMQRLVWTEVEVAGPKAGAKLSLPQPSAVAGYYRDVAVLAFPKPARDERLPGAGAKSFSVVLRGVVAGRASWPSVGEDATVPAEQVADLTEQLSDDGTLTWDVPPGQWLVLRVGHTPTGKTNHPAPESGRGLECDKLSRRAVRHHFDHFIRELVEDVGPLAGRTFVATHVDSWEVGVQNWTPGFRDQFRRRRGYDPVPWLPVVTGRVVGSVEQSERFLWDLRQTVSELLLENYADFLRQLAHQHGLRLTIEAYTTCPTDELAYAGRADEPMGEFWSWRKFGAAFSCTEMASAAHVYGKPVVGAEAFTANNKERWLGHPGNIKDLGDWAFCEGINRFVFHRYALQPWPDRRPGMSMGPWGLHYERTQTWWDATQAWHQYLSRCQFLLQKGRFVADICLLTPEGAPQTLAGQRAFWSGDGPAERPGHNFDVCPPEAVQRMSVRNGQLVLPSGMTYRVLVLPKVETMTPGLLRKIKELVEAGATVIGCPPRKSPSLSGYPECDREVQRLAKELWGGTEPPKEVTVRRVGRGRVVWGGELSNWTSSRPAVSPPVAAARWIWFDEGQPSKAAPPETRWFVRRFEVPTGAKVRSAVLALTADNAFVCWLNGERVGSGDNWGRLYRFDVRRLVRPGRNVLAVAATNATDRPNPAGLIAALLVQLDDGRTVTLTTDARWLASRTAPAGWPTPDERTGASGWRPARDLGPFGVGPWGSLSSVATNADVYLSPSTVSHWLEQDGLPPDFAHRTASGQHVLRYIHRRLDGADVYFVANKTAERQVAVCAFRVGGRRPELWWPASGRMERPAVYDVSATRTTLPLALEPFESVFVVFPTDSRPEPDRVVRVERDGRVLLETKWPAASDSSGTKPSGRTAETWVDEAVELKVVRTPSGAFQLSARRPGRYTLTTADGQRLTVDLPPLPAERQLTGPWQLRFVPGWGAPERVTLPRLVSWSEHPDPGVRYYSGTGTYRTSFRVEPEWLDAGKRLLLDLGRVEVVARVKVNGHRLGTLWWKPFVVDVTEAVRPGENTLEVSVANLWVNRLIGDEHLPEDSDRNPNGTLKQWPRWLLEGKPSPTGRYTFTTWRLWSKEEPLVPSGLLGPVRLVPVQTVVVQPVGGARAASPSRP